MVLSHNLQPEAIECAVIPFLKGSKLNVTLPSPLQEAVEAALESGSFSGEKGEIFTLSLPQKNTLCHLVLVGFGSEAASGRQVFLAAAKAFKKCRELKVSKVAFFMDNAKEITHKPAVTQKLCEVPFLAGYDFSKYRTKPKSAIYGTVEVVTALSGFEGILKEATICAESTLFTRDLVNTPSMDMTPQVFAQAVSAMAEGTDLEVQVLHQPALEALGMHTFLAVGRGAPETPPELVVLRYRGGKPEDKVIGLVGKGIMYDSGGYSLKPGTGMFTMFNDMGGGAAVAGAMRAIAKMGLSVNVTAVIPACENKIGPSAYVPGDILYSMSGKTIEMLNTDAEGRLVLADALTYIIREEKVDCIADIATLTGAAKTAVGGFSAAVMANDDGVFAALQKASAVSCEKVWRLDLDEEIFPVISSAVADIKNSVPGSTAGAGSIIGGLFLQAFVEDLPWVHIDCAPVGFTREEKPEAPKGATGYGCNLLYHFVKEVGR